MFYRFIVIEHQQSSLQNLTMRAILISFIFIILTSSWSYAYTCRNFISSIYHLKITYDSSVAYEIISFHARGSVSIIDNTENDFTADNSTITQPFSSQVAQWICVGQDTILVRAFNFNYKTTQAASTVSSNTMYLIFTNSRQLVQGNYTFAYYQLGDNPINQNKQPIDGSSYGPYTITGERWLIGYSGAGSYFDFHWCLMCISLSWSFLCIHSKVIN